MTAIEPVALLDAMADHFGRPSCWLRTRSVKRWRDGKMILRWTVAASAHAATRFRRVMARAMA